MITSVIRCGAHAITNWLQHAYASGIPGYNGKHWATPLWRKRLLPIVRKKLIQEGLTLHASPDSALKVLTSEGEHWSFTEEADRFVFHRLDRIVP